MKRLGSSDSLGALMSICPTATEEHNEGANNVYSREFQSMLEGLDEEGCVEESGHVSEKKRRLSVEQVKALEKNFEVENKLEPERKVKLAQELGLQPRQVAVWFQNRRARWKTKQLERDYNHLKANYDALKHKFESLQHDNEVLLNEIRELKSKLNEENSESQVMVKEEAMESESDDKVIDQSTPNMVEDRGTEHELNFESFNGSTGFSASVFIDFKDQGSSDSDSSAILNEDSSPNAAISSSGAFLISSKNGSSSPPMHCCSSSSFHLAADSSSSAAKAAPVILGDVNKGNYQSQLVKIEEHNFFSNEESCSTFFSDDQPPSLHWYCSEDWN